MPQITVIVGDEWHSSYSAKGYVFVVLAGLSERALSDAISGCKLLDREIEKDLGDHGEWRRDTYEVPDGIVLKLFDMSYRHSRPDGGGSAYVRIKLDLPQSRVYGEGYQGRCGQIIGPVEILTAEQAEQELNMKIPARLKRFYRNSGIEIEEIKPCIE